MYSRAFCNPSCISGRFQSSCTNGPVCMRTTSLWTCSYFYRTLEFVSRSRRSGRSPQQWTLSSFAGHYVWWFIKGDCGSQRSLNRLTWRSHVHSEINACVFGKICAFMWMKLCSCYRGQTWVMSQSTLCRLVPDICVFFFFIETYLRNDTDLKWYHVTKCPSLNLMWVKGLIYSCFFFGRKSDAGN